MCKYGASFSTAIRLIGEEFDAPRHRLIEYFDANVVGDTLRLIQQLNMNQVRYLGMPIRD